MTTFLTIICGLSGLATILWGLHLLEGPQADARQQLPGLNPVKTPKD